MPRFQAQFTPVVLPVLVKLTGSPEHCGAVEVKLAIGVLLMEIVSVVVAAQLASATVNVTILNPDESYNTPAGFADDETAGTAPCPKSQS